MKSIMSIYHFLWMMESHYQQSLAWQDAAEARVARDRAEQQAAQQLQAMLDANPSGQLGHSQLNDEDALKRGDLL